ncbi:DNA-binding response regulator, LuxR family [Marinobacterium lacunae]|uniref:DNA-binding response regulator, LuxR family n=1 Tax=Marinobacterium lacunae TaxID=1232683 RepID=A0A081FTL1_9GAMM|nr:response regulator transcription factor [Marinobacterium lacunae]KEA61866.1 DNA-binding response regulator, LuxR family [Marinobacterium lacunae]MBR9884308.1 response regulator transcription factor [Oceanospirillales bacterium]
MSNPIRVLLVDDHSIVRFGYQQLLMENPAIKVVAEAENCADALNCYRLHTPDVVILDLSMPMDSSSEEVQSTAGGLEAIRRILSHDNDARILVVSGLDTNPYPQRAVQAGVQGYVTKRNASSELKQAVENIASGKVFYSKSILHLIDTKKDNSEESQLSQLTSRELEIFSMIAEGHSVNHIAEMMHLSPKTIHAHRANLMRKLGISSNSDIIHIAMRAGILQT